MTGAERRLLRARAHDLKPTVHVGKLGLSAEVLTAVDQALDSHELIKVRLVGSRDEKEVLAGGIEHELKCERVGMVGHVGIFFRQNVDPERRRIVLPD